MRAKLAIKSDNITPFGGIFYVMDEFSRLGMSTLIDCELGMRCSKIGYQYSQIISSIAYTFLCGGSHIEDIGTHLGNYLELRPDTKIPSPDTNLRGIKELATDNIEYCSDKDVTYSFNTADKLNNLLIKALLHTGQLLVADDYDMDFDHQFIPTEKKDTRMSYKKKKGYFPGVATIGSLIVGIENRDGNTNVRFHQADTLTRIIDRLNGYGVHINRLRMDCGSYSKEIISTISTRCNKFYIRASRSKALTQEVSKITGWKEIELNSQRCELTSIPFTAFMEEKNYRLVIQKTPKENDMEDMFDGKFTYRCIVTNDWESKEEEIVTFYNARGTSEKVFDVMNNDFGWRHLPCSYLNQNTAFLLITAIAANFYQHLIAKVATVMEDLKPTSRTKHFVFRFITVPAKWIKRGRQWVLNVYTKKAYKQLWET